MSDYSADLDPRERESGGKLINTCTGSAPSYKISVRNFVINHSLQGAQKPDDSLLDSERTQSIA